MSLSRTLYLASRMAGDAKALQKGRMPARYAKRVVHRRLIGFLRRAGLWSLLVTVLAFMGLTQAHADPSVSPSSTPVSGSATPTTDPTTTVAPAAPVIPPVDPSWANGYSIISSCLTSGEAVQVFMFTGALPPGVTASLDVVKASPGQAAKISPFTVQVAGIPNLTKLSTLDVIVSESNGATLPVHAVYSFLQPCIVPIPPAKVVPPVAPVVKVAPVAVRPVGTVTTSAPALANTGTRTESLLEVGGTLLAVGVLASWIGRKRHGRSDSV